MRSSQRVSPAEQNHHRWSRGQWSSLGTKYPDNVRFNQRSSCDRGLEHDVSRTEVGVDAECDMRECFRTRLREPLRLQQGLFETRHLGMPKWPRLVLHVEAPQATSELRVDRPPRRQEDVEILLRGVCVRLDCDVVAGGTIAATHPAIAPHTVDVPLPVAAP